MSAPEIIGAVLVALLITIGGLLYILSCGSNDDPWQGM